MRHALGQIKGEIKSFIKLNCIYNYIYNKITNDLCVLYTVDSILLPSFPLPRAFIFLLV